MPNNSGDSFAESLYRKMSDDELQNTLRCEMFSEGALDNTQSEMILAEMERRRINEPTRSPEDAWAEFESDYSGRESAYSDFAAASVPPEKALHADKQRRKRCSKRKAILLAAVICVLLTSLLTVQAAGIDVFGAIARWTTELFSFGKTEERSGLVVDGKWPEIDEEQNLQFASLQDALDFYGVTESHSGFHPNSHKKRLLWSKTVFGSLFLQSIPIMTRYLLLGTTVTFQSLRHTMKNPVIC